MLNWHWWLNATYLTVIECEFNKIVCMSMLLCHYFLWKTRLLRISLSIIDHYFTIFVHARLMECVATIHACVCFTVTCLIQPHPERYSTQSLVVFPTLFRVPKYGYFPKVRTDINAKAENLRTWRSYFQTHFYTFTDCKCTACFVSYISYNLILLHILTSISLQIVLECPMREQKASSVNRDLQDIKNVVSPHWEVQSMIH